MRSIIVLTYVAAFFIVILAAFLFSLALWLVLNVNFFVSVIVVFVLFLIKAIIKRKKFVDQRGHMIMKALLLVFFLFLLKLIIPWVICL